MQLLSDAAFFKAAKACYQFEFHKEKDGDGIHHRRQDKDPDKGGPFCTKLESLLPIYPFNAIKNFSVGNMKGPANRKKGIQPLVMLFPQGIGHKLYRHDHIELPYKEVATGDKEETAEEFVFWHNDDFDTVELDKKKDPDDPTISNIEKTAVPITPSFKTAALAFFRMGFPDAANNGTILKSISDASCMFIVIPIPGFGKRKGDDPKNQHHIFRIVAAVTFFALPLGVMIEFVLVYNHNIDRPKISLGHMACSKKQTKVYFENISQTKTQGHRFCPFFFAVIQHIADCNLHSHRLYLQTDIENYSCVMFLVWGFVYDDCGYSDVFFPIMTDRSNLPKGDMNLLKQNKIIDIYHVPTGQIINTIARQMFTDNDPVDNEHDKPDQSVWFIEHSMIRLLRLDDSINKIYPAITPFTIKNYPEFSHWFHRWPLVSPRLDHTVSSEADNKNMVTFLKKLVKAANKERFKLQVIEDIELAESLVDMPQKCGTFRTVPQLYPSTSAEYYTPEEAYANLNQEIDDGVVLNDVDNAADITISKYRQVTDPHVVLLVNSIAMRGKDHKSTGIESSFLESLLVLLYGSGSFWSTVLHPLDMRLALAAMFRRLLSIGVREKSNVFHWLKVIGNSTKMMSLVDMSQTLITAKNTYIPQYAMELVIESLAWLPAERNGPIRLQVHNVSFDATAEKHVIMGPITVGGGISNSLQGSPTVNLVLLQETQLCVAMVPNVVVPTRDSTDVDSVKSTKRLPRSFVVGDVFGCTADELKDDNDNDHNDSLQKQKARAKKVQEFAKVEEASYISALQVVHKKIRHCIEKIRVDPNRSSSDSSDNSDYTVDSATLNRLMQSNYNTRQGTTTKDELDFDVGREVTDGDGGREVTDGDGGEPDVIGGGDFEGEGNNNNNNFDDDTGNDNINVDTRREIDKMETKSRSFRDNNDNSNSSNNKSGTKNNNTINSNVAVDNNVNKIVAVGRLSTTTSSTTLDNILMKRISLPSDKINARVQLGELQAVAVPGKSSVVAAVTAAFNDQFQSVKITTRSPALSEVNPILGNKLMGRLSSSVTKRSSDARDKDYTVVSNPDHVTFSLEQEPAATVNQTMAISSTTENKDESTPSPDDIAGIDTTNANVDDDDAKVNLLQLPNQKKIETGMDASQRHRNEKQKILRQDEEFEVTMTQLQSDSTLEPTNDNKSSVSARVSVASLPTTIQQGKRGRGRPRKNTTTATKKPKATSPSKPRTKKNATTLSIANTEKSPSRINTRGAEASKRKSYEGLDDDDEDDDDDGNEDDTGFDKNVPIYLVGESDKSVDNIEESYTGFKTKEDTPDTSNKNKTDKHVKDKDNDGNSSSGSGCIKDQKGHMPPRCSDDKVVLKLDKPSTPRTRSASSKSMPGNKKKKLNPGANLGTNDNSDEESVAQYSTPARSLNHGDNVIVFVTGATPAAILKQQQKPDRPSNRLHEKGLPSASSTGGSTDVKTQPGKTKKTTIAKATSAPELKPITSPVAAASVAKAAISQVPQESVIPMDTNTTTESTTQPPLIDIDENKDDGNDGFYSQTDNSVQSDDHQIPATLIGTQTLPASDIIASTAKRSGPHQERDDRIPSPPYIKNRVVDSTATGGGKLILLEEDNISNQGIDDSTKIGGKLILDEETSPPSRKKLKASSALSSTGEKKAVNFIQEGGLLAHSDDVMYSGGYNLVSALHAVLDASKGQCERLRKAYDERMKNHNGRFHDALVDAIRTSLSLYTLLRVRNFDFTKLVASSANEVLPYLVTIYTKQGETVSIHSQHGRDVKYLAVLKNQIYDAVKNVILPLTIESLTFCADGWKFRNFARIYKFDKIPNKTKK